MRKSSKPMPTAPGGVRIRVLALADPHQLRSHYGGLARAIADHRPNVVAMVGDVLDAVHYSSKNQLTAKVCAHQLAALPVEHLIFVRGNHEDFNWPEFVAAWPHERRPLTALYGTACSIGPLVIVGFPCLTGSEFHWCCHLSATDNVMEMTPGSHREPLHSDYETWLPALMRKTGPAGRTLWLMHEPPVGPPIADPRHYNSVWKMALERFRPWLAIAGHDHSSPLRNRAWLTNVGPTNVVNVGQSETKLHYTVLDFEFEGAEPALPAYIKVSAYPWNTETIVSPDDRRPW